MPKICSCGCGGRVFSKGLCKRAWSRQYSKPLKNNYRQLPARTTLKPRSKKRGAQEREYARIKREQHPRHLVCEAQLQGCTFTSIDIHHMQGRENGLLLDQSKWLWVCRACHDWIGKNSAAALAEGLSLRRNT